MWGLYTNTTPLLSTRGPLSVALALTLSPIGESVGDSGGKWGDSPIGTRWHSRAPNNFLATY